MTSRYSPLFIISKKTLEKSINKEQKTSHRPDVVVRHASKALRPPEVSTSNNTYKQIGLMFKARAMVNLKDYDL
jgi:hypothetical protein